MYDNMNRGYEDEDSPGTSGSTVVSLDQYRKRSSGAFSNDPERQQSAWFEKVSARIGGLESLPANWDTYDGCPPSPHTRAYAAMVAGSLWQDGLGSPHVSSTSDGSIMFEWSVGRRDAVLAVHGPLEGSFYFIDREANQETEGTFAESLAAPRAMISRLLATTAAAAQG